MTGKPLYAIFLIKIIVFCWSAATLTAQDQRLSNSTYQALNNHLVYSNEAVYAANEMYFDFIYLNEQFYNYIDDPSKDIIYQKDDILTNFLYFPVLPRNLYSKILDENNSIVFDKRGAPLQLAGKVSNVLKEIEDTRILIAQYINNNDYKKDSSLTQGFKWLRRVEVLYYDLFTLQEKLHWNLTSIAQSYTHPPIDEIALHLTQEFQTLLTQTKAVIKSVRAADGSNSLGQNCLELMESIQKLKSKKEALLEGMELNPLLLNSPDNRFEDIINRASDILQAAQEYKKTPKYQGLNFSVHYYYYNINILNNYNRVGDGIATLFNKFVSSQDVYWLYEHEMPYLFKVLYPDLPEYEQFKESAFDIEKIIQEALLAKTKADSIANSLLDSIINSSTDSILFAQQYADSIEYRKNHPEVGDKSLTDFATNNLVFLLDVSYSMNDSNKLPLLKDALLQLLDLMRPEDNITFVTFAGKAQVLLPPTSATYKDSILATIKKLKSSGFSDANTGIRLAYETIEKNIINNGNNRIILATDGGIKVSTKIRKLIRRRSKTNKDKIFLSIFYFSSKEYSHHKQLLENLAAEGAGKYSYIQKENAEKILLIEAQAVRKS